MTPNDQARARLAGTIHYARIVATERSPNLVNHMIVDMAIAQAILSNPELLTLLAKLAPDAAKDQPEGGER